MLKFNFSSRSIPFKSKGLDKNIMEFFDNPNFQMVEGITRYISGVTQQERGKHEPGVRTAFEVAQLEEGSDSRNNRRIKKLNNFSASVMSNMLRIASDNIPVAKIASLIGLPPEFAHMIMPFDKMALKIKFGSTAAQAQQQKLNRLMMFTQLATQLGLQLNPQVVMEMMSDALGLELWENSLLVQGGAAGAQQNQPPAANLTGQSQGGGNAALSV